MIAALLASTIGITGTTVTIQDARVPDARYEIVMLNMPMNGPADELQYVLTIDGLDVHLTFDWDAEGTADALAVSPPDGFICRPSSCVLVVDEGGTGVLYLIEWVAM